MSNHRMEEYNKAAALCFSLGSGTPRDIIGSVVPVVKFLEETISCMSETKGESFTEDANTGFAIVLRAIAGAIEHVGDII